MKTIKKRKSHKSDESGDNDYFKIEDYKITNLQSLINLTKDLSNKKEPPKKKRKKLPKKIYKLIDIIDPLEDLNSLIGLESLKEQLMEQLLFFIQEDFKENDMMLHTVIEGPPGTGKTTVAKIMAEIYAGIGIFKKYKFNVIKRNDLIGQYLGETTYKTMEVLEDSINGVILIDEAYSLGGHKGDSDSYAKEAIDAINEFLSENKDRIICIIAGYKKELDECFFKQNPGLRRRFPWTFTIVPYTDVQLKDIFIKMLDETNYELDDEITDKYIIDSIKKEYFLGNAGDIENLINRMKIISAKENFGLEYDKRYIINKKIFDKSFDEFYNKRKEKTLNDNPPFGMYV